MALDRIFSRLSLQSQSVCRGCRRTFASTRTSRQQQSATTAFADQIRSSNESSQSTYPPSATRSEPRAPPTLSESNLVTGMFGRTRTPAERQATQALELERQSRRKDIESNSLRRWAVGDVYSPRDLGPAEQSQWKRFRNKPKTKFDVLDQLGINPLHHYKNFSMMSEYMTEMGRIKHRKESGLRAVNQRRMAKAIRRAIGIGLLPGVYYHPELLKRMDRSRFR